MNNKLLKNKTKVMKILQIIQMILSLFLISFLFVGETSLKTGLVLPDSLFYLPLIIVIVLIIFLLFECIYETPFIRMILMVVLVTATLNFHKNTNYLSLIFSIYGILHLLFLIYDFFFHKKKKENLAIGIYTYKQKNLRSFLEIVVLLICSSLFYLFYGFFDLHWLVSFIFIFIIALLFIIPILFFTNPLIKIIYQFQKDCSFETLNKEIEKYKANALHPETYHYLCTLQAKYYLLVDQNKGLQILQTINPPTYKYYNYVYLQVKEDYSLIENNSNNLEKIILKKDETSTSNFFYKIYDSLYYLKNSPFVKVLHIYQLMNDCYQKKDFMKAKEYAHEIIQHNDDFNELKKGAQTILKEN